MKEQSKIIGRYTKMFDCPENNYPSTEGYEHIQQFSNKSYIYFHLCKNCRLRFDTDVEKQDCPRCQQLSKNIGFEIREFEASTVWEKFKDKISEICKQ